MTPEGNAVQRILKEVTVDAALPPDFPRKKENDNDIAFGGE